MKPPTSVTEKLKIFDCGRRLLYPLHFHLPSHDGLLSATIDLKLP